MKQWHNLLILSFLGCSLFLTTSLFSGCGIEFPNPGNDDDDVASTEDAPSPVVEDDNDDPTGDVISDGDPTGDVDSNNDGDSDTVSGNDDDDSKWDGDGDGDGNVGPGNEFIPNGTIIGTCNTAINPGGGTQEIHAIDLGTTSGSFGFYYQTSQQVRMELKISGSTIFDTGCVSAEDNVTISYSEGQHLVIEVTPNCEGGSGVEWVFEVYCN